MYYIRSNSTGIAGNLDQAYLVLIVEEGAGNALAIYYNRCRFDEDCQKPRSRYLFVEDVGDNAFVIYYICSRFHEDY